MHVKRRHLILAGNIQGALFHLRVDFNQREYPDTRLVQACVHYLYRSCRLKQRIIKLGWRQLVHCTKPRVSGDDEPHYWTSHMRVYAAEPIGLCTQKPTTNFRRFQKRVHPYSIVCIAFGSMHEVYQKRITITHIEHPVFSASKCWFAYSFEKLTSETTKIHHITFLHKFTLSCIRIFFSSAAFQLRFLKKSKASKKQSSDQVIHTRYMPSSKIYNFWISQPAPARYKPLWC